MTGRPPSAAPVAIRRAAPEDAPALAALGAETFRDTFERQNREPDMRSYLKRSFSESVVARELRDPSKAFLLAVPEDGHEPIGYAGLCLGEAPEAVTGPSPIEIRRLYVRRSAQRSGVGSALMRACFEHARVTGHATIWLGVWEHNTKAIAYYRRWGFLEVGSHRFLLGKANQTDLLLERPVAGDEEPG